MKISILFPYQYLCQWLFTSLNPFSTHTENEFTDLEFIQIYVSLFLHTSYLWKDMEMKQIICLCETSQRNSGENKSIP